MLEALITAILDDDRPAVQKMLQTNVGLAARAIDEARLYERGIFHWLYVGDTPLHLAAAGYRVEIVELLLAAGAEVNACTNHRRSSPLHYAADGYITGPAWNAAAQVRTLQVLLAAGADIHARDKNGATPLHRAVRTRCAAAVDFLLAAGACTVARNNSGSTPFHLAGQKRRRAVESCLPRMRNPHHRGLSLGRNGYQSGRQGRKSVLAMPPAPGCGTCLSITLPEAFASGRRYRK